MVVATKGGQVNLGEAWIPLGRPEYLRQQAELSLRRLRVDRIDVYQLHRIDPAVPLADQIGALRLLQDQGKVRHVGLSEVSADQLTEAQAITPIVSVQNRYNLGRRLIRRERRAHAGEASGMGRWLSAILRAKSPA